MNDNESFRLTSFIHGKGVFNKHLPYGLNPLLRENPSPAMGRYGLLMKLIEARRTFLINRVYK